MNIDYLSQLSVDIFIEIITYLSFKDVINICSLNQKLRYFCNDTKYNNKWRKLIDNTFGKTYNYDNNLLKICDKLDIDNIYNCKVYTQFIRLLDPITQLTIYYSQNDTNSFNDSKFNDKQRFLALFLLEKKYKSLEYFPSDIYIPFIDMLNGRQISEKDLNKMMVKMAREGSPSGVLIFLKKGAYIHALNDFALKWASDNVN